MEAARDHTQVMIKGKRTRRRNNNNNRPTTAADHSSSLSTTHCSNESNTFYVASSEQESESSQEEDHQLQDMANCLILLARGHNFKNPSPKPHRDPNRSQPRAPETKPVVGSQVVYQCKTCDRTFPSFQALGGHRASHNKAKLGGVASDQTLNGLQELDHQHQEEPKQSNLCSSSSSPPINLSQSLFNHLPPKKPPCLSNKVHECSICGAEFMSGQALGGHMRRHRVSSTTSGGGVGGATVALAVANSNTSLCLSNQPIGFQQEDEDSDEQLHLAKKSRMVMSLDLDLNLPAPEDGGGGGLHHHLNYPSKQQETPLVLHNLVGCHY